MDGFQWNNSEGAFLVEILEKFLVVSLLSLAPADVPEWMRFVFSKSGLTSAFAMRRRKSAKIAELMGLTR